MLPQVRKVNIRHLPLAQRDSRIKTAVILKPAGRASRNRIHNRNGEK